MQQVWKRFKPYFQVVLLVATLTFLGITLRDHWQEVLALQIQPTGFVYLAIAMGFTLLAHIWVGWVWSWILAVLGQQVSGLWAIRVYLKTNVVKYLPSNVLHFYARTAVAINAGIPLGTSTLSVLLEPLLMVAAALVVTLVSSQFDLIQGLGLLSVLIAVHPRILNPLVERLSRLRAKKQPNPEVPPGYQSKRLKRYPLVPLLGEIGFILLRATGFIFTVLALSPLPPPLLPTLFGAFSIGWLLGFVVPGSPGGLGVFEVTVVTLLNQADPSLTQERLPQAVVLGAVALYRLISVLMEGIGAGLAWMDEKFALTATIGKLQGFASRQPPTHKKIKRSQP